MNFKLIRGSLEYKGVIKNLMQFYIYDFTEYVSYDVGADGLFEAYPDLESYFEEENQKFAYIIKKDGRYIGFVLVKSINSEDKTYFSIAEFFIMKKYRRKGVGKAVAGLVFNLHNGEWEVYQKETNKPAYEFWKKVIAAYTKGQFKERFENGRTIQEFKN